jgi:hypothetical protein
MSDLLGYAASCAVLATFLMRTMVPLRLIAILSNVLFLVFGYAQHIYPVFFLHVALLPINTWRLVAGKARAGVQSVVVPPLSASLAAPPPYVFWFAIGLLAGLIGSFAVIVMAGVEPI